MVDILGPDGAPVRNTAPVRSDQTSKLAHLHREVADHPTRGLTPSRLAGLYEEAEQGDLIAQARLGMDMEEKDAHIFAELGKRKLALQATDWHLDPPEDATPQEERATDLARAVLDELDIADLIFDLSDAVMHGFVALEYHWQLVDGVNRPTLPEHRPQDWFQTSLEQRNTIRLRDASANGAALRPLNWILHVHKSRSGFVTRAGLVRVLGWPFLMRALSTRDLAEFLEIYGLPLRLGKYPVGSTEAEKLTLLKAVVNIGHAAAGIIPEGMQIDFKEAAKGAVDPFEFMTRWSEGAISKAVLGGTLTSTAEATGLGSNQADVQNEVRGEILKSDARQIARCIELQFIRPIVALNTNARRAPRFVFELDQPDDIKALSEALPALADAGMRIPVEWAHERLQIPMASEGQAILGAAPAPAPPPAGNTAAAVLQPRGPGVRLIADPAPELTDRLAEEAATPLAAWLDQIREMAEAASSLDDLRDRLINAYGDLDSAAMVRVMEAGFAVADASGRFDVSEEAGLIKESGPEDDSGQG